MKKLLAALALVSLAGCFYQVTSAGDIDDAQRICADHKGINHIAVRFEGSETVTCQDDLTKFLHRQ